MKIYGGRAGYNSVSFIGNSHQSISRFKKGKITTEIRPRRKYRITHFLSRIPFVRSFTMVFELVIEHWRRFLFAIIVLYLMDFLHSRTENFYLFHTLPINTLEVLTIFLIVAGIVIKITQIGKYHAAEHMTANAMENGFDLTLDNVKKQPRTHVDCGTNLAIAIIFCYSLLFWIFGDSIWILLASWSFGYELWASKPKIIWNFILVISKVIQYLLLTTKPQELHLTVAIEAMTRLEVAELEMKKLN